jgi:hypothetical protein
MAEVIVQAPEINQLLIEENGVTVTVEASTNTTVAIITEGPQGPRGFAGAGYDFVQSVVSTSWIINHNLGYKPAVDVYDSGSQQIQAEVSHTSVNQTAIVLTIPSAGFARLT